MTFQHIITHLGKPHSLYIVLTGPHAELSIKKQLERQGFITYVPVTSVRRCWAGYIKEIHTQVIKRCVYRNASYEYIPGIQNEYTVLSPQTVTALYQNQ